MLKTEVAAYGTIDADKAPLLGPLFVIALNRVLIQIPDSATAAVIIASVVLYCRAVRTGEGWNPAPHFLERGPVLFVPSPIFGRFKFTL